MLRICGASGERDALSRSRCWCRGLFCGPGGARRSTEFRRDFGKRVVVALSRVAFERLTRQLDLYDGDARAAKWWQRVDSHLRLAPSATARKARA